jgi:hypothetical protein
MPASTEALSADGFAAKVDARETSGAARSARSS